MDILIFSFNPKRWGYITSLVTSSPSFLLFPLPLPLSLPIYFLFPLPLPLPFHLPFPLPLHPPFHFPLPLSTVYHLLSIVYKDFEILILWIKNVMNQLTSLTRSIEKILLLKTYNQRLIWKCFILCWLFTSSYYISNHSKYLIIPLQK